MVTALCLLLMFFTGLIPVATFAIPAMAGLFLTVLLIEIGAKWAFLAFLAVAFLALFLAPDKEAAYIFLAFFGYYPILKAFIERIHSRVLEWTAKLAVFNGAIIGCYSLILFVFRIPNFVGEFGGYSSAFIWVLLLLGNGVFILYDVACTRLVALYLRVLRPKLSKRLS